MGAYFESAPIRAWLWFLTQGSDCKIFQNKTLQDILQDVFSLVPGAEYALNLMNSYEPKEYCVQYGETHFNFIQRLLQREGVYYYWEHTETAHTMMICDNMVSHKPEAGFESVVYRSHDSGVQEDSYLSSWKMNQQVTPGSFCLLYTSPSPRDKRQSRMPSSA